VTEDPFVAHRGLLFTVAYEMLGSAADAEDVLQESWLRWADIDHSQVNDPRAYLIRIVTRQALNQMRTLSRRREDYIGEWLPEPLLTSPDIADDVELAESGSIAMLTVLETLAPTERAVFVLHQVFDMPYGDIAAAVGKSPAAVRLIALRAREHVAARRPRVQVSRSEQQAVVERFLTALRTGKLQDLMGRHGTGRGPDRRWWRNCSRRSGSDPRGRRSRKFACASTPGAHSVRDDTRVAQRRARDPCRDRWPGGRGERGGRKRAGHADLRRGKPTEVDAPG
jgi:RNA polymerase sigma factor (sigma-70 family)